MKKIILTTSFLLSALAFGQVGINTENPQGVFNVDGANDNPSTGTPTATQQANDFVVTEDGSVGIGTTAPDASAILHLDVNALATGSKKGFLGPKVALTSNTDQTTIPSPAVGLLVYNLGTHADFTYEGYVFWGGAEWRSVDNSSLREGTIGSITCNGVSLTPSIYESGTPYEGVMIVPYTGGNGGTYSAQTVGPVNGLTATLAAGNFAVGAGNLSYTITGTPTVTTPDITTFSLNIGGQTCDASVGSGDGVAPGDLVFYKTNFSASVSSGRMSDHVTDLPILGGKLRLDMSINSSSNCTGCVSVNPILVNTSASPVKVWFSAMTTVDRFNAGNYLIAPGGYVNLDNGIYYGYGFNDILGSSTPRSSGSGTGANQEIVTLDVSVDDKWYRVYYFPTVDNMNTSSDTDNQRVVYLSIQRLY